MKNCIILRVPGLPGYLLNFQKGSNILSVSKILISLFFLFYVHLPATGDNVITTGSTMTVVAGTSVVSMTSVVIQNGGALNNSGTLTLKNNLANDNLMPGSLGSGTVILSGTTAQTVSGQSIIQDLIINNPSGIVIAGNTRVNGTLTLTNGNISIGSQTMLLGPSAALAGTPSSTAMIIVTGSGELRKEFPTGFTGVFTYPVGDDTGAPEYSPVTLNFMGGAFTAGNYVGVNLKNSVYPDPNITGNYLKRYWNITQSGITGFNCHAFFQYLPSDVTGTENLLSCTRVNPLPWITYALTNASSHQLTAQGITSFGAFTGVKSSTPPANQELANITIPNGVTNCYDATNVLTVAGNGKTFIVENNGSVTLVAGMRISILPGARVYSGGYLYAHITTDGTYCGSIKNQLVASLENEEEPGSETADRNHFMKVYPNPTTDIVMVDLLGSGESGTVSISVYSIQGSKLLQETIDGESRFQFSLSGKPVGLYMVHVQSGDKSVIAKVIKN